MKRLFLLAIALAISLLISECVVLKIIGYPRNVSGIRKFKISENIGQYNVLVMWPPYYPTWSVEGGNKLSRLNNKGLPGPAISGRKGSKNIILLGNSFIEGLQYPGESIAAGVLQRELSQKDAMLQVINLGSSSHDPYVLWHRLQFYEKLYRPDKVILIFESFDRLRHDFSRWSGSEVDFSEGLNAVEQTASKASRWQRKIRSMSGYINLTATMLIAEKDAPAPGNKTDTSEPALSDDQILEFLQNTLLAFNNKYGADFMFVSLMRDSPFALETKSFCIDKGIAYYENLDMMTPMNQIDGEGHFNLLGNRLLGEYLHEVISREDPGLAR